MPKDECSILMHTLISNSSSLQKPINNFSVYAKDEIQKFKNKLGNKVPASFIQEINVLLHKRALHIEVLEITIYKYNLRALHITELDHLTHLQSSTHCTKFV